MATRMSRLRWCVGLAVVGVVLGATTAATKKGGASFKKLDRDTWQQPERVMADLRLTGGMQVADVGCGNGYFTFRLAEAVGEKGKVFATEISKGALKNVSTRAAKEKVANIQTVLSEPTKTKLAPESVDATLIAMVLHHVPKNLRAALTKDIARAIRPGGYLYILEWRVDAKVKYDKDRRISRTDLIKLATDAGLTLDAEFHYLPHQVFMRLRKPPKPK